MVDKPKETPALGLVINPSELRGAYLSYQHGTPVINDLFSIHLNEGESSPFHVKPLYMKGEEERFKDLLDKSLVVSGLPSSEVLIRNLQVPLLKEKEIDAVLEFQAEPLIPYPIEEAIIDRMILSKNTETTDLSVIAARTDHLSKHIERYLSIQIEPEVISCTPVALAAFSDLFHPHTTPHFIVHLGYTQTTCVVVAKGKVYASKTTLIGVDHLKKALNKDQSASDLFEFDFINVSNKTTPILSNTLEDLKKEIAKLLLALSKQTNETKINDVMWTGEGTNLHHLTSVLSQGLDYSAIELEDKPSYQQPSKQLLSFAEPIGLALTALPKAKNQINFRQKEFIYPHPWKRIKKPISIYLGLCLAFAFSLYLYTYGQIASEEDQLKREYVELLTTMKKPVSVFEKNFQKINQTTKEDLEEIDIITLTQEDILERLNFLEKEILAIPDIFPLYPNTPQVSDVLAWLSSHPHIAETDTESGEQKIQLKSFSYKMVKRPDKNKKNEKYQVKVELEFTSPLPRYAREFHDILLAPNDIVDPKGDVKWGAERGSYRASFFLKDRTSYPTTR